MTNEEKAREIAEEYRAALYRNTDNCFDENDLDCSYEDMRTNTLNMAEWKDQQFKEYLEKKKEEITCIGKAATRDFQRVSAYGKCNLIDEIINELFKED